MDAAVEWPSIERRLHFGALIDIRVDLDACVDDVQFTPSLGRVQKTVSRTREVFPTCSTTLLRLQL